MEKAIDIKKLQVGDTVKYYNDDDSKSEVIESIIFNDPNDLKNKGDRVTINGCYWNISDIALVRRKKKEPKKVSEVELLNEAQRIRDYYKDCFLLGFGTEKNKKFLHFAQGRKDKFTIKKGIHKNIVMLDSKVKDYEEHIEKLSKSRYKQCKPIPASLYFGV